ncbi:NmrA-like family protein [Rhodofomes roseus]|uniref:NmrA-like family protein n=1 Tax=Rhodofomes roseus TaxID=34475 RepID=A0ABQ8K4N2_9APHY|nr:NmrA-like family protein [Rhodofomes roseus]KAH9831866.1 NmrA-like family protein [Rhodofomes roseus]
MTKYVLTGATGGLGSQTLLFLLHLVPASDIIVSLHNPAGASPTIVSSGVEVRKGDYADPASLRTAFAGADKLFLVSYPSIAHELRVRMHKNAIDAATAVGIKHVYYTSLAFGFGAQRALVPPGEQESVAEVMQAHLDTEAYLKQSGLTYTIIREGIYSESYPLYFGFWSASESSDEVVVPHGDGGIAWVNRPDLGEGTARIIAAESGYENRTLLLSGTRIITLSALASTISALLNRPVRLKVVSEDEYVAAHTGRPGPRGEADFLRKWATTYRALVRGECAVADPTLKEILGREPTPFDETVREMLGVGGEGAVEQYAK